MLNRSVWSSPGRGASAPSMSDQMLYAIGMFSGAVTLVAILLLWTL